MERLTYQQAYNKVIEAYFKDEIIPQEPEFCFCGTLCSGCDSWQSKDFQQRFHSYSYLEYGLMEKALFSPFKIKWIRNGTIKPIDPYYNMEEEDNYEQKLFEGMSAALDVLKEIHRSRNENVDEGITHFSQRILPERVLN